VRSHCFKKKRKRCCTKQKQAGIERAIHQQQERCPTLFRYPPETSGKLFAEKDRIGTVLSLMENVSKKIEVLFLSLIIMITKVVLIVPPGTCKFSPSCTEYAKEAVRTMPFHKAMILIVKRLLRCNPFARGGDDPLCKEQGKG
jgi:putative membrane protein insertion efficiency factor